MHATPYVVSSSFASLIMSPFSRHIMIVISADKPFEVRRASSKDSLGLSAHVVFHR